jgi:hypothetical protein
LISHELQGVSQEGGEQNFSYREELIRASQLAPISSGYPWIDKHLLWNRFSGSGGFAPTMMTTCILPSENGKTSLATAFAVKWIARGYPAIILSAEEARHNLAVRVTNAYTGIRASEITRYMKNVASGATVDTNTKIEEALELIQERLFVYEVTGEKTEMKRLVRRHRTQFGDNMPILVEVDHIGAVDSGQGNWSRTLGKSSQYLKSDIANELRASVVVYSQSTSQMERQFREHNFTTHKQARGSRGIYNWSDGVIGGCRHNGIPLPGYQAYRFEHATCLQSLKNRFRDDSMGITHWGTFEFDVEKGIIGDLITDDVELLFESLGKPG